MDAVRLSAFVYADCGFGSWFYQYFPFFKVAFEGGDADGDGRRLFKFVLIA